MIIKIKLGWLNSKTNIIQKLTLHIIHGKEEGSKLINDIIKQIVQD